MERANFSGQITQYIKVNFKTIILMDMAFIFGSMGENMKDNGKIIKCKVRANSHGQMEESI